MTTRTARGGGEKEAGMFGAAEEVFHPGAQYAEDERQRLEHSRFQENAHAPGKGPIDLDSGRVLMGLAEEEGVVLPARPRVEESDEEEPRGVTL
ncbi:DUF6191 domain-containing protein [Streptomyces sp. TRM 70351]|uniref:DUF6191 domain-containing protein n=1 Tax=Streptomyces sp. TRM 70351 TaxID=3116552 RepID=UPI002E7BB8FC|nr:DUF6191 domain-containing protein [Streptomyces sp. TRM 70351]MEE1927341.1 DUF6191 domain-containing protein [Streptomyces sp. TRM 70351]